MDAAAFLVFYPVRPACLETVLIDYFLHTHIQHYGIQRDFLLYIRNFIDSRINESRHYYYYISLFSWLLNYCVRAPSVCLSWSACGSTQCILECDDFRGGHLVFLNYESMIN